MTQKTLSIATLAVDFPVGTAPAPFVWTLTGTQADGSAYSTTVSSDEPTVAVEVPSGQGYTVTVSRLGHSSLPSAPFAVVDGPVTVSFTVPDSAQAPLVA